MGPAEDLDAAVQAARAATHELLGVLVAHQMVPGILNLHLAPNWPVRVQAAYLQWEHRIHGITHVLARNDGVERGAAPGEADRTVLILRACVLGLDLADPPE